jgi:hypothetical protein
VSWFVFSHFLLLSSINLYVSLCQYTEAKKLIFHVLQHFTPVDQEMERGELPTNSERRLISREQYNRVIDIYLIHILEPTEDSDSILKLLSNSNEMQQCLPLSSTAIDKNLVHIFSHWFLVVFVVIFFPHFLCFVACRLSNVYVRYERNVCKETMNLALSS